MYGACLQGDVQLFVSSHCCPLREMQDEHRAFLHRLHVLVLAGAASKADGPDAGSLHRRQWDDSSLQQRHNSKGPGTNLVHTC